MADTPGTPGFSALTPSIHHCIRLHLPYPRCFDNNVAKSVPPVIFHDFCEFQP